MYFDLKILRSWAFFVCLFVCFMSNGFFLVAHRLDGSCLCVVDMFCWFFFSCYVSSKAYLASGWNEAVQRKETNRYSLPVKFLWKKKSLVAGKHASCFSLSTLLSSTPQMFHDHLHPNRVRVTHPSFEKPLPPQPQPHPPPHPPIPPPHPTP